MTPHRFSNREKIGLSIMFNLLWWLGNDTEQTVDQAEWYHQDWPEWRRSLGRALRNPLQNFRAFVMGYKTAITKLRSFTGILILKWCSETT